MPIKFLLNPGQAHDLLDADNLLTNLGDGDDVLGDKAYDGNWLRQRIEVQGAASNIPNRSNRKEKALHFQDALQGMQPRRTILRQDQEFPPCRHALRNARSELSRHYQAGFSSTLAGP